MSDHWRIGDVERSVLETLRDLGAQPDRPHIKCARVVRRLNDDRGVNPRYGYDALCTLSQRWLQQVVLVDFHGNCGSPDDRPANARYTEARLSPAGVITLAAERGEGPKVPVALINGDLHVDGFAPPYSPTRVIAALLAMIDDRRLTDAEIVELVGPPESPTGCGVACDYRLLAAGEPTAMIMTAELTTEPLKTGTAIVLTNLPLGIGCERVMSALVARVNSLTRLDPDRTMQDFAELGLPLKDVRDESYPDVMRIVCELRSGADLAEVEPQIAGTWGVRTRSEVQLAAPLAQLMRDLVHEDPEAQRGALAALSDCLPRPQA